MSNMGVDRRGNRRDKCTACDCDEFQLLPTDDNISVCFFCEHYSPLYKRIEMNEKACIKISFVIGKLSIIYYHL